jgi:DNA-binding NarL/FixJ family response regulator
MSLPARLPKVLILCSSPLYASGLQKLIESSPGGWYSEVFGDPMLVPLAPDSPADPVLVGPRDWQELGGWISPLRKRRSNTPWVVLTELRTVGLFLPMLDAQPCVVLDPARAPDDLWTSLRAAASNDCWHLPTTLLSGFMQSKAARPDGCSGRMPSITELAVCCGVALGLSNPEIAEALLVSEATVKTHLHRLMSRMGLDSRTELGNLVNRALAYQPQASERDVNGLALAL